MLVSAYRALDASQLVNEGPTLITGFILSVSTDASIVTLYDGLDTDSGVLVGTIASFEGASNNGFLKFPILLNNGLYVLVGSDVILFTILYVPLRGNSPLAPYGIIADMPKDM